jgi:hypothetical protein
MNSYVAIVRLVDGTGINAVLGPYETPGEAWDAANSYIHMSRRACAWENPLCASVWPMWRP